MVVEDFASQSDMAATLLSQMRVDVSPFTLSRNIFARNAADTPKFGFWSYNNGFGIITADGYVRHNLTNDTTTECEGNNSDSLDPMRQEYVQQGKAIVQWLHQDLIKR